MTVNGSALRSPQCRCVVRARATLAAQQWKVHATGIQPGYGARTPQRGLLRLFLDSADVRQWEKYQQGTLHGFTTNPLILERDRVPCMMESFKHLVQQAHKFSAQELQIQSWGDTSAAMEATALEILDLDPSFITIKLPCTPEGLSAASALIARDPSTKITITGVYRAQQVLLAQAIGADYVAPYLGRIADQLGVNNPQSDPSGCMETALDVVTDMQCGIHKSESSMRILVASIRDATQISRLSAQGCNTFTFSPAVAEQLLMVPETLQAAEDFEAAAARNSGQGQ